MASGALIVILGFTVYANSLAGEFIWDDHQLIQDNAYIKNWSHIVKVFTKNIASGSAKKYNSYRPLQMVTYMADYSLWRLRTEGYHLTNILFHVLAALSIYWLVSILFKDNLLSFLAGAFFVVHPVYTEAVAYISGRADSMVLLFTVLCFIFYIKRLHALMIFSYALALLSRENALILPVLLLMYHYVFKEKIKVGRYLSILVMAVFYILLRFTLLSFLLPHASSSTTLVQRIPGFFVAITNYIRLLLMPLGLHMEYGNPSFSFTDPKAIIGVLILFSLLIYAFKKRENRLISFSVFWFFIALLPVSNLYPLIIAYMAEHWLYLPSIGFFLVLASTLSSFCKKERFRVVAIVSTVFLITFYSYLTVKNNEYWREPLTFYERTLRYTPDSVRSLNALGMSYVKVGRTKEAIKLYERAKAIKPDEKEVYYNLGIAYRQAGKRTEALESLKEAIEMDPAYVHAYNALGIVYRDMARYGDAIRSYKKAIEISPYFVNAYINLGLTYSDTGKKEEAISVYRKALEIDPANGLAYNNLAIEYYYKGQYKSAIEYCDKARELGFTNPRLLKALEPHR